MSTKQTYTDNIMPRESNITMSLLGSKVPFVFTDFNSFSRTGDKGFILGLDMLSITTANEDVFYEEDENEDYKGVDLISHHLTDTDEYANMLKEIDREKEFVGEFPFANLGFNKVGFGGLEFDDLEFDLNPNFTFLQVAAFVDKKYEAREVTFVILEKTDSEVIDTSHIRKQNTSAKKKRFFTFY